MTSFHPFLSSVQSFLCTPLAPCGNHGFFFFNYYHDTHTHTYMYTLKCINTTSQLTECTCMCVIS